MTVQERSVLHYRSCYLPLSETFIHQFVSHLTRWRPVVMTGERAHAGAFPLDQVEMVRGIALPQGRWGKLWWQGMRRLLYGGMGPVEARVAAFEDDVRACLRRHRPGLLHAHFAPDALRVVRIASEAGCPLVTTFYGFDIAIAAVNPERRREIRPVLRDGTLFLVEGPHMRRMAIQAGCPADRIHVQRIGVDLTRLPFNPPPPAERRPVRVLMSGRLVEKKGMVYGVRAFARALRRCPALRLTIIGDGPQRAAIEGEIRHSKLSEQQIVRHAFLPYPEYCRLAGEADIYLAPSVTASDGDAEGGAPTTLLEMQAMGKPIVATRHADIPYVVREGESALLADERDVEGLAEALVQVATSPQRWASMGRAGRAQVEAHHDILHEVRNLEQLYDQAAEMAHPAQDDPAPTPNPVKACMRI